MFKYGSIVFFNIPEAQHLEHIRRIQEAAIQFPVSEGLQHVENYKIMIDEQLEHPSVVKAEHVNIRKLDSNNLSIIGSLMAQTVALDYYTGVVDGMVEEFTKLNIQVEETGEFKMMVHYNHEHVAFFAFACSSHFQPHICDIVF